MDASFSAVIVIPSLNPGKNLPEYVAVLSKLSHWPIVIVDDGSDIAHAQVFDKCAKAAPNVTILHHKVNCGKGRALKTAFAHILSAYPGAAGCITCDSDGQHSPEDVMRCAHALETSPNALVLGCRSFGQDHVPLRSRFGNTAVRAFFSLATGRHFSDTQTGLRAISTSFMRTLLDTPGERFDFETRMLLSIDSLPLVEIPIATIYLDGNKSSHFRPLHDSLHILGIVCSHIIGRFWRFTVASLLSFALDISLFWLLHETVFANLQVARLAASIVVARICSAIFNYYANLIFVFNGAKSRRSFTKYAILALILVALSYLGTAAATNASSAANAHRVITKAIVDLLLFMASFAIQRLFVFSSLPSSNTKS